MRKAPSMCKDGEGINAKHLSPFITSGHICHCIELNSMDFVNNRNHCILELSLVIFASVPLSFSTCLLMKLSQLCIALKSGTVDVIICFNLC